jgi:diguanylate cyclase (GGDEF)-like protein
MRVNRRSTSGRPPALSRGLRSATLTLTPSAQRSTPSDADRAAALASPLVTGVDPPLARNVLAGCAALALPAGATLLAPGDHNASLFLVTAGRLLVYLEDPSGKHYLGLETGDCVGEMSFIDGRPASAHVLASTDSRVLEIGNQQVWDLIDGTPEFARNLLRILASRVRNDNAHLQRSFHLQREYEQAAKTDLLTGVHNRRWMDEMFPRQIARSEHAGQPLALVMADIDHFKRLNDTYGHATGDVVLRAVARRLSDTLRPTDFLVRYGGEEFVALLPGATAETAHIAAERVRKAIEHEEYLSTTAIGALRVTISLGIAILQPGDTLERLIERADVALYQAKAAGRNRVITG